MATAARPAPILVTNENVMRGVVFSLGAIIVGIIAWVILWRLGFMAAIVSFVIAWLAVKLYVLGAGGISRRSAPIILTIIVAGIVLAFLSGMASDALAFYLEDSRSSDWFGALLSGSFWNFFFGNILTNGELWGSYITDIIIALVFGALGAYSIIKSLFMSEHEKQPAA